MKHKGGRWEKIEGRPGERNDEFLIGDLELPFTQQTTIGGITHYLVSFNDRAPQPLAMGLSSANTDPLSDEEILKIVNDPPQEELR